MTTLEMLIDVLEDPHNNGDYRLNLTGDELNRFWRSVENDDAMLRRLRQPAAGETEGV